MTSVKSALPGPKVPIGSSEDGKTVIYLNNQWFLYFQADHNRVGGNPVDKVEVAAQVGVTATAAAATANTAAATAQAAADAAAAAGSGSSALQALVNSGVNNACTIGAFDAGTDATVTVSANTRYYGDGTSVAVNSGSVTGVAYGLDAALIYYDDPTRAGGAVTYLVTTDPLLATPTPAHQNRHYVGSVPTPAALDPPNVGSPNFYAP